MTIISESNILQQELTLELAELQKIIDEWGLNQSNFEALIREAHTNDLQEVERHFNAFVSRCVIILGICDKTESTIKQIEDQLAHLKTIKIKGLDAIDVRLNAALKVIMANLHRIVQMKDSFETQIRQCQLQKQNILAASTAITLIDQYWNEMRDAKRSIEYLIPTLAGELRMRTKPYLR